MLFPLRKTKSAQAEKVRAHRGSGLPFRIALNKWSGNRKATLRDKDLLPGVIDYTQVLVAAAGLPVLVQHRQAAGRHGKWAEPRLPQRRCPERSGGGRDGVLCVGPGRSAEDTGRPTGVHFRKLRAGP